MIERVARWMESWWFWWLAAGLGTAIGVAIGEWTSAQLAVLVLLAVLGTWSVTRPTAWFLAPIVGWLVGYRWMGIWSEWAHERVSITPVAEMDAWVTSWFVSHGETLQSTFAQWQTVWLDAVGAFLYLTHTAGVFGFVVYCMYGYIRDRGGRPTSRHLTFTWGFLVLNVLAFSVWVIWPVAPPWYLETFGATPPAGPVEGDPAGIARVDAWLGVEMFGSIYGSNEFVFGAMPSLHVGYPAWFVLFLRRSWSRILGVSYVLAMGFFAVYFNHHYLVDVAAGVALAVICRWFALQAEFRLNRHAEKFRQSDGRS